VKTTIVLADAQRLLRDGLRKLLEERSDLAVVAEAARGDEALDALRKHKPDVAILDVCLAGMSGIDVIRNVRNEQIATKCIVVSTQESHLYVKRALEAGAVAYVAKTADKRELFEAIDAVRSGRAYLSASLADLVVAVVTNSQGQVGGRVGRLTVREREILALIGEGLSTREIAARLGVSPRTVETHRANLMAKLSVHRASMLVRIALEEGLVQS
jgi:DNA-binding NarL/FixJ family response regulator